jgi:hypothetical protein
MGADRQGHQADESNGNGGGAAGDAELTEVHRVTNPKFVQRHQARPRRLVA